MSTFATVFACWVALLLLIWPMFIAAGRADDAMERWYEANR